MAIAHCDEVEGRRREAGHLGATWTDLGTAAGSVTVGVQRIEIDPEGWSTPAHSKGSEEEIFFVLGGSGISWQEGEVYDVRAGDCLVHLALEETHTLRAGPGGLDVLAFGMRSYAESTHLPRAGVSWLGRTWVEVGADDAPWTREAAAGEPELKPPSERPARIVNVEDVEARGRELETIHAYWRDLGRAAGSERTGLKHIRVEPSKLSVPPHCHSAEEEIFVVLEGDGTLLLGEEEHPVRRGQVVARPAGTGVAHSFRGGPEGMTVLAYGTREPNDIAYYPRSNKIYWRGVGVIGRVERLDYWDGEV